ncbi:MAG TPA: hypothetical protein VN577_22890 [Terriglobales bacterium]|nr:hypothetical protein [Terriglobales bacterium]
MSPRKVGYIPGGLMLLVTLFLSSTMAVGEATSSSAAQQGEGSVQSVASSGEISIKHWDLPKPNSLPQDLFVSRRDGSVWFSAPGVNALGRFDPKTQKFEEIRLRPESDPYRLVEHAGSGVQSRLFFSSHTGGFIAEYDSHARELRELRIQGGKMLLHDLSFDPNGVIWFTIMKPKPPQYPQGSKVGFVNLFTSEIKLAAVPGRSSNPYSLAVTSKGTPFFSDLGAPKLLSIHPVTMKITEHKLPSRKSGVMNLTITPDDRIWFTDNARGYIGCFNPETGTFDEWASPGGPTSSPSAITNAGKVIWYSEAGTGHLVRFDTETKRFQMWTVQNAKQIEQLYANNDGSVWFALPKANQLVRVTVNQK